MLKAFILVSLLLATMGASASQADDVQFKGPYDEETLQQRDSRMAWWREARFGLFIHWGLFGTAGTHQGKK